jgi:hypothetical protein
MQVLGPDVGSAPTYPDELTPMGLSVEASGL